MSVTRIPVGGEHPYEVVVGTGVLGELPSLIGKHATSVMVIAPEGLDEIARPVGRALGDAGYDVHTAQVPAGEAAKDISVAAALWSQLAASRITRSDAIVGVGGGAATDLAGFVAATWLRGVRVVLVPTTLLAMTDAAVGGKTAVDIPEGKNLVGRVPSAGRGPRGPDRAGIAAARRVRERPGRGDQGRVHRRPGDPRADRGGPGRGRSSRTGVTPGS